MTPMLAGQLHAKLVTAAALSGSTVLVAIVDRHAPERHAVYLDAVCGHCYSLCHSHSGLGCDSPDAPWPCPDVRDIANVLSVDLGGSS